MKNIKSIPAVLLAASMLLLTSCKMNSNIITLPAVTEGSTTASSEIPATAIPQNPAVPSTLPPAVTQPEASSKLPSVPSETTTANQPQNNDYSSFTKKQILDTYAAALGKTRSYTGNLTVHHNESLNAEFKNVSTNPGGDRVAELSKKLGNYVLKKLGDGDNQEFNFVNGKCTNQDNEVIPILLPQKTEFALTENGIQSAMIEKKGNDTHIVITLVPEKVSMGQVPEFNSKAIGYLDTSKFEFKVISLDRVDINYPGSSIDATIRPDGYISYVKYTIPMFTDSDVSGMGIKGSGTIEGKQTEEWTFKW